MFAEITLAVLGVAHLVSLTLVHYRNRRYTPETEYERLMREKPKNGNYMRYEK